jgi:hypothetical protein
LYNCFVIIGLLQFVLFCSARVLLVCLLVCVVLSCLPPFVVVAIVVDQCKGY